MKKITFLLMGLLLFACNNDSKVSAPDEAEGEWVYGQYKSAVYSQTWGGAGYEIIDGILRDNYYAEQIYRVIVYNSNGANYIHVLDRDIPPLKFEGNKAFYESSFKELPIKLVIEKNGDCFYLEFTAPRFYEDKEGYHRNEPNYHVVYTSKNFLCH